IERHAESFAASLDKQRRTLEAELAATAKRRAEADYEVRRRSLEESIAAKESQLARSRAEELALRRQMRELEEAKKGQELEYQRKLDAERRKIEERAGAAALEELARREAQWKAQLASAQREATDLKRKLDQGSQQLQGEALELSLESLLKSAFPLDEILPVPKGINGADLVQHVRSASGLRCGAILWEAKQTKAWQQGWLPKLKHQQQEMGAEAAILVTAAMPKEAREPFLRESDVWIARFDAARPLAEALRACMIEMQRLRQANLGRSEKAELLYAYLCGPQFTRRMKAAVEGFAVMRADLEAEKAAMTRIWKKREAQLSRMSDGLLGVVGDLQGIGQETLPQLEGIAALPGAAAVEVAA
ncbi:MAG TPA: DUF2130 domain-containing protein, partial [Burkholderiales bacterium]|nr:DUF2130 domain-containing protein [Burkholderiales bacterium]